jgi:[acyl-carrier-protein] S-malonyltransferase
MEGAGENTDGAQSGATGGSADGDAGAWIAEIMSRQAMSPVHWQETIENMAADGIRAFIEIGPGSTLSGLVKKINHELITMNIEDHETLMKTIDTLKSLIAGDEPGEAGQTAKAGAR